MSASKWKPYPSYKESVERESIQIPSHWEMISNRHLMKLRNQKVGEDWSSTDLLSLTLQGIILRDIDSGVGKYPASFETYQIVEKDDLVFCLFDIAETPRTIGISKQRGMITGAYDVLTCVNGILPNFIHDYYLAIDLIKGLEPYYTGLRKVVRTDTFKQMKTPIPPLNEQLKITKFIQNIDVLTTSLQRILKEKIDLLEEKRLALITQAVTKGLNPNVSMKDSGIQWIGEIPEHWGVTRLGWHCTMIVPMRDKPASLEGEIPWIRIEDFDGKYIGKSKSGQGVSRDLASEMNLKIYPIGTVLCTASCNLGTTAITTIPLITNQTFIGIETNNDIDSNYLYYFMNAASEHLQNLSSGAIQQYLSRDDFKSIKIPYIHITEQQRIASYVDKKVNQIDSLVQKTKTKIDNLKQYRTALISAAVTGKIDVRESV